MKKIILTLLTCACGLSVTGQTLQNRHELSLWGAGGLSTLHYKPVAGKNTSGLESAGGYAGIGYSYFLNDHWSLGLGAEYSLLNAQTSAPLLTDHYLTPGEQSAHIYRITVTGENFVQKHHAQYVQMPLSVRFQSSELGSGKWWYAGLAFKGGMMTGGRYATSATMTTTGEEFASLANLEEGRPFTDNPYANMPHHGFGTYSVDEKTNLKLWWNLISSLETGVKWRLSSAGKWFLYTGVFVDYGWKDVHYNHNAVLYEYNAEKPASYTTHSVFSSRYRSGALPYSNSYRPFVDRVNTVAAGIKLQLTIGFKPFAKKVKPAPPPSSAAKAEAVRPLTYGEVDEIVSRNTEKVIEAQKELSDQLVKELSAQLKELLKREDYRLKNVHGFNFDKTDLVVSMLPVLEENLAAMKAKPEIEIVLVGHTDDRGSDAYNIHLGLRRAQAVKTWLVEHDIDEKRLTVASEGFRNPAIPNAGKEARRYNRRVDFVVLRSRQ
ncbi:MAG: OmpA family protein [Tannerella sp.]|nr:OmpA family protein [Tannerella sp.]